MALGGGSGLRMRARFGNGGGSSDSGSSDSTDSSDDEQKETKDQTQTQDQNNNDGGSSSPTPSNSPIARLNRGGGNSGSGGGGNNNGSSSNTTDTTKNTDTDPGYVGDPDTNGSAGSPGGLNKNQMNESVHGDTDPADATDENPDPKADTNTDLSAPDPKETHEKDKQASSGPTGTKQARATTGANTSVDPAEDPAGPTGEKQARATTGENTTTGFSTETETETQTDTNVSAGSPGGLNKNQMNEATHGDTDPADATDENPDPKADSNTDTPTNTDPNKQESGDKKKQTTDSGPLSSVKNAVTNLPSPKKAAESEWDKYWKQEGDLKESRKRANQGVARARMHWRKGNTARAILNYAGAVGEGADAGLDYTFDNPNYSIQENIGKPGAKQLYEAYDFVQPDRTKIGAVPDVQRENGGTPTVTWNDVYVGENRGKWSDNEQMSDEELAKRMHGSWEGTTKKLDQMEDSESSSGLSKRVRQSNVPGSNVAATGMDLMGMAPEIFVGDTGEAVITGATGVNPESKKTEADPATVDFVDVASFGLGNAATAGRVAGRGTAKGANMAWYDEAFKTSTKSSDEGASGSDEAAAGSNEDYTTQTDEFDTQSADVGYNSEFAADYQRTINQNIDEVGSETRTTTGDDTSVDEYSGSPDGSNTGGGDAEFTVNGQTYTTSDLMGKNSRATLDETGAADESTSASDDATKKTPEEKYGTPDADPSTSFLTTLRGRLPDSITRSGSAGDETSSASDDATKTDDGSTTTKTNDGSTTTKTNDGSTTTKTPTKTSSTSLIDRLRTRIGSLPGGKYTKIAAAGGTVYLGADLMSGTGSTGSGTRGPGKNNGDMYWAKTVKQLPWPAKMAEALGDRPDGPPVEKVGRGQQTLGYNVPMGRGTDGKPKVLDKSGRLKTAVPFDNPQANKQYQNNSNIYFKPTFNTVGAAETAYQSWMERTLEKVRNKNNGKTPAPTPDYSDSAWKGSLSPPKAVRQGESFSVDFSVSKANTKSASTRLVLGIPTSEGVYPLGEKSVTAAAAAASRTQESTPATTAGSFSIPAGQLKSPPGDHTLLLLSMDSAGRPAKVTTATLTVKPADDGSKNRDGSNSGSTWDDPQRIRALEHGWHLFSQTKVGSNETRFMVIGKKKGRLLFLAKDGSASTTPYYHPTIKEAVAAFKRWAKRFENNATPEETTPNPGAGRPDPSRVKKETAAHDSTQSGGPLSTLSSSLSNLSTLADERPLAVGGAAVALVLAAVVARKQGWI